MTTHSTGIGGCDLFLIMSIIEDIERQAFLLPEDQRLELAQKLISSVEPGIDPGAEEAWDLVIQDRIDQYNSGQLETVSASKVFSRLKEIAPEQ